MVRLGVVIAAIAVALAVTGVAQAGCFATVGIEPLPTEVAAGETWTVDVMVRQHGVTPMPDATPTVLVKSETGAERAFPAVRTEQVGRYRADVIFPSSGRWSVAVHDGFPEPECARTQTFGSYSIGPSGSPGGGQVDSKPEAEPATAVAGDTGSSLWPLWLGLGVAGVLALAGLSALRVRRTRLPGQAQ
jgi:hypothetical protein